MYYLYTNGYFLGSLGLLAILNAIIAQQQGRNALIFFLLTLILGPLVTVFLLVTAATKKV